MSDKEVFQQIHDLITKGYTYNEITVLLQVSKRTIYKARHEYNILNNSVKRNIKKTFQLKKDRIINDYGITDEEFNLICINAFKKRSTLAKQLNMDKFRLNMILMFLKE